MAGDRQHHLPQFLQRPFANEAGLTWLFRKGQSGVQVNTRNVGVERGFYTQPNNTTVDDAITEAEADISRTVRQLRTAELGQVNAEELPRLFSHLEVRSRHLRQSFLQVSESLYTKILPILGDVEELGRLITRHISNEPENFEQIARDALREEGLPESGHKVITETVSHCLPQILQGLAPDLETARANVLEALPKTLRDSIKNSHIGALSQTIAPELRAQTYEKLVFSVEDIAEENMILGDCGAIFHVEGSRPFKAITEKSDIIMGAILPIAPDRLLVGANPSYRVNSSTIRTAIARCSLEFFIAAEDSDANADLAKLVGFDAAPLSEKEIQDIVDDALR